MKLNIECEREEDGRWLAEVPELPGALAYGATADEVMARAEVLALRVIAERIEHGEARPVDIGISVAVGVGAAGRRQEPNSPTPRSSGSDGN